MASYFIGVRVERELKENFEIFCEKCGMTVSGAINIMVKKAIETKSIPFEVAICEPMGVYQGGVEQDMRFSVRIEKRHRDAFRDVCNSIGIPMARIIKLYMLRCLSCGKIPF